MPEKIMTLLDFCVLKNEEDQSLKFLSVLYTDLDGGD
jgi:hypothetical protein